jgi:hypothetical protein
MSVSREIGAPAPGAPIALGAAAAPRRLARRTRRLLAAAALLLGTTYVAPLWHIRLKAPQYPEGLGMYIWSSRITGQEPHHLQSINGLNHYIGMKEIVPEAIPELRLMPPATAVLIALGIGAALWGRRRGLIAWAGLLLGAALVGLADFWKWGYEYGHDLDPGAAIKIPGMSYQPPLFGTKQLLNFQATSLPALGGWMVVAALAIALALVAVEWRAGRSPAAG